MFGEEEALKTASLLVRKSMISSGPCGTSSEECSVVDEEGGVMNRREFLKSWILSVSVVLALCGSPGNAAAAEPVTVLVTYHSATGNTEKMAQGVAEGAKAVPGTSVVLKRVGEVAGNDLLSADAVIVGSPVYFGNM